MAGRIIARVVAGIALAVAITVGTPDANATTLAPLTIEQVTDGSTYIVEGHVEEVWTELDSQRDMVWTRARVAITATHKGPDQPVSLIVDTPGGRYGDIDMYVPSSAVFSEGEDVFLFLNQGESRLVPVGLVQGKYTVRRAPGETRQHVMTWAMSKSTPYDARFLPHPAPADRVYLDDLREQVQNRLDLGWDGQPIPGITAERLQTINSPAARNPGSAPVIHNTTPSVGSQP